MPRTRARTSANGSPRALPGARAARSRLRLARRGNREIVSYLIERLDRSRFQPWLYYYPSGAKLGNIAEHMSQTMARLEYQHGIERFFVVAHSMGILNREDAGARVNEIPAAAD